MTFLFEDTDYEVYENVEIICTALWGSLTCDVIKLNKQVHFNTFM